MTSLPVQFLHEVTPRLEQLTASAHDGAIAEAVALLTETVVAGGVIHAFGTGHSEAFAMEVAGRAGGLIPTNKIALRDVVLWGERPHSILGAGTLERDPAIVDELWATVPRDPRDVFVIASNSGVNGSIVGMALKVKEAGHRLIAVTSLQHTAAVTPKHPSGKRLRDLADIVIDNLAPYGDTTTPLPGRTLVQGVASDNNVAVGAVSSLTSAFIAQLLTMGVAQRLQERAVDPLPLYISANVPGGDEHNHALLAGYEGRLRREG